MKNAVLYMARLLQSFTAILGDARKRLPLSATNDICCRTSVWSCSRELGFCVGVWEESWIQTLVRWCRSHELGSAGVGSGEGEGALLHERAFSAVNDTSMLVDP